MPYEKRKRRKASVIGPAPEYEKRWQAEEDLRALIRAKEVRRDPERLKAAKAIAKEQLDKFKGQKKEAETAIDLAEGMNVE